MALLLSQDKMIDWLTESISKQKSLDNNKEVNESKQKEEGELDRENAHDYIRKNERIIILMITNGDCKVQRIL